MSSLSQRRTNANIPENLAARISSDTPIETFESDRIRISVFKGKEDGNNWYNTDRWLLIEFEDYEGWSPILSVDKEHFIHVLQVINRASQFLYNL